LYHAIVAVLVTISSFCF